MPASWFHSSLAPGVLAHAWADVLAHPALPWPDVAWLAIGLAIGVTGAALARSAAGEGLLGHVAAGVLGALAVLAGAARAGAWPAGVPRVDAFGALAPMLLGAAVASWAVLAWRARQEAPRGPRPRRTREEPTHDR